MLVNVTKESFKKEVTSSTRLVIVDLYAPWCGPCKLLAPALSEIAEKHADAVKVVKVNVDEEESLAVNLGVTSIPTVLFFKNGKRVFSFVGTRSASEIETMIKRLS